MASLTLITPTCDRPAGIGLAKRWLKRQELREPATIQWLVCDDGREKAELPAGIIEGDLVVYVEHVRIPPAPSVALSFRGNVAAGLCRARCPRIAIWEDDDWYPPDYLQFLLDRFHEGYELIGQARARYYNVATRRHRQLINASHASLCQSAVSSRIGSFLEHRCRTRGGTFLDLDLWREHPRCARYLHPHSTVVGIKGLPGKAGIGMGHRLPLNERFDRDGSVLRRWIGDDAEHYLGFYRSEAA